MLDEKNTEKKPKKKPRKNLEKKANLRLLWDLRTCGSRVRIASRRDLQVLSWRWTGVRSVCQSFLHEPGQIGQLSLHVLHSYPATDNSRLKESSDIVNLGNIYRVSEKESLEFIFSTTSNVTRGYWKKIVALDKYYLSSIFGQFQKWISYSDWRSTNRSYF